MDGRLNMFMIMFKPEKILLKEIILLISIVITL